MNLNHKILLADDHPLMLKGLEDEFKAHGFRHLFFAKNGLEATDILYENDIDIAILDVEMPLLSGFEVIQKIKISQPICHTKFIIITYHKEPSLIIKAKHYGVLGYLLKDNDFEEIKTCLAKVSQNQFYLSSSIDTKLLQQADKQYKNFQFITPSERTILRLIVQGLNSSQIAENLSLSVRTVEKHRSNIIQKLNINTTDNSLQHWVTNYKDMIFML